MSWSSEWSLNSGHLPAAGEVPTSEPKENKIHAFWCQIICVIKYLDQDLHNKSHHPAPDHKEYRLISHSLRKHTIQFPQVNFCHRTQDHCAVFEVERANNVCRQQKAGASASVRVPIRNCGGSRHQTLAAEKSRLQIFHKLCAGCPVTAGGGRWSTDHPSDYKTASILRPLWSFLLFLFFMSTLLQ